MNEVLLFVNKKIKLSPVLKKPQFEVECRSICSLCQQNIANLMQNGKQKVKRIIQELMEDGYGEMIHTEGCYIIAPKRYQLLNNVFCLERLKIERMCPFINI